MATKSRLAPPGTISITCGYELIDRIYDEVEAGLRDYKLINL